MIVPCVCGVSLDDAKIEGTWTIGDIVCEYRTCAACKSTRAYMPIDELRGRRVDLILDPETSEIAESWDTLLEALEAEPRNEHAVLMRNGVALARRFTSPKRSLWGWRIEKPELEIPLAEWAGAVRK